MDALWNHKQREDFIFDPEKREIKKFSTWNLWSREKSHSNPDPMTSSMGFQRKRSLLSIRGTTNYPSWLNHRCDRFGHGHLGPQDLLWLRANLYEFEIPPEISSKTDK